MVVNKFAILLLDVTFYLSTTIQTMFAPSNDIIGNNFILGTLICAIREKVLTFGLFLAFDN